MYIHKQRYKQKAQTKTQQINKQAKKGKYCSGSKQKGAGYKLLIFCVEGGA